MNPHGKGRPGWALPHGGLSRNFQIMFFCRRAASFNKRIQQTPNTPRPAANAFGILSQHSAPRSVPLNSVFN